MSYVLNTEHERLKAENHDLKEQLKYFIPRRRVRRVYKQLKEILEQDIVSDDYKKSKEVLENFIKRIELTGTAVADNEIKKAIEIIFSESEIDMSDLDDEEIEATRGLRQPSAEEMFNDMHYYKEYADNDKEIYVLDAGENYCKIFLNLITYTVELETDILEYQCLSYEEMKAIIKRFDEVKGSN